MKFSDQIKGGFKRRFKDIDLPGGSTARIRNLSEKEKSKVDAKTVDHKRGRINRDAVLKMRAEYIVACVVDEAGNPEFTSGDVDTICDNADSQDSSYLYAQINKHIGGDTDDFEELVGNSNATPDDSSP